MAPPKEKQFMDNLPKFCLSRNGAYPKFKVLVHFWLDQIYPSKAQNIAKSSHIQKGYLINLMIIFTTKTLKCHSSKTTKHIHMK